RMPHRTALLRHVRMATLADAVVHAPHGGHVMAVHGALVVLHGAHHVDHVQMEARVHRRYRRTHARLWRQCAAGVAGAVDGLREDGPGAVGGGLHDHVQGFGHRQPEFVDRHRVHVLAVGSDHGHFQAGYAHVEDGHG